MPTDKRPSAALTAWGMAQETEPPMQDVPYGFCHCGCGERTNTRRGKPRQFLKGHHMRLLARPPRYLLDETTGCWIWQGYITPDGYGRGRFEGRYSKLTMAHRWYYEQHVGPIPADLVLDHLCRNRRCCNPDHLEAVTIKENILRGEGMGARWARRTHCEQGHELAGDNLQARSTGGRRCLTCHRNGIG